MSRRKLIVAGCCLSSALIALSGCAGVSSDRSSQKFDTRAEAMASTSADGGWVPSELPANATDITLTYDLDSNEQLITWHGDELDASCIEVTEKDRAALEKAPDEVDRSAAERCIDGYQSTDAKSRTNTFWVPAH